MLQTLQPLLDALQGDQGWLLQLSAWMVAFRTIFKPFSAQLQAFLDRAVLWVQASPETDDDLLLERLLASRAYRFLAFLLDFFASIKLPSRAALKK